MIWLRAVRTVPSGSSSRTAPSISFSTLLPSTDCASCLAASWACTTSAGVIWPLRTSSSSASLYVAIAASRVSGLSSWLASSVAAALMSRPSRWARPSCAKASASSRICLSSAALASATGELFASSAALAAACSSGVIRKLAGSKSFSCAWPASRAASESFARDLRVIGGSPSSSLPFFVLGSGVPSFFKPSEAFLEVLLEDGGGVPAPSSRLFNAGLAERPWPPIFTVSIKLAVDVYSWLKSLCIKNVRSSPLRAKTSKSWRRIWADSLPFSRAGGWRKWLWKDAQLPARRCAGENKGRQDDAPYAQQARYLVCSGSEPQAAQAAGCGRGARQARTERGTGARLRRGAVRRWRG
eukprot:m.315322 g.315322  ORF g.315322 m.315322 type:complete len:355 (-) comp23067_c0_seq14:1051-2115(-)